MSDIVGRRKCYLDGFSLASKTGLVITESYFGCEAILFTQMILMPTITTLLTHHVTYTNLVSKSIQTNSNFLVLGLKDPRIHSIY